MSSAHLHLRIRPNVQAPVIRTQAQCYDFVKCIVDMLSEHTIFTVEVVEDHRDAFIIWSPEEEEEDVDSLRSIYVQIGYLAHMAELVLESY